METTYVYSFGEGRSEGVESLAEAQERRRVLGGKGAGLAEMTAAGLPVPPGFTISCQTSLLFLNGGGFPAEAEQQMNRALAELERRMGRRLGDENDPLLVSVRSGSPKSMPGMMDTVLNLGLNSRTVQGLARRTNNERFAWDAYRRFIQGFSCLVLNAPKEAFDEALREVKAGVKATHDHELTAEVLKKTVVPRFLAIAKKASGRDFPEDPREQLVLARDTVFRSWRNARAIEYRRRFGIPDDLGTAVNVQAMVFGNMGDTSATGVGFTRDPATGANTFYGEFLPNAQGEDVVAGVRTPLPIAKLEEVVPAAYRELREHTARLEKVYRWPQDFEFTIEDGRLYLLQTRDGKSTAQAAIHWAVDFLDSGLITEEEALLRIDPSSLDQLLHPVFDPKARAKTKAATKGLAAGPGAASGVAVFTAKEAVARAAKGEKVVLVRAETCADDIAGMIAAQGVLTATGGMTSHAAVVGRQLGKPCVVGAGELAVSEREKLARLGRKVVKEGDAISIDGGTGEVFLASLPTMPSDVLRCSRGELSPDLSELYRDYARLMSVADRHRRLGVRANADKPSDAQAAFQLGALGIGLCRTEHMFFEESRLPVVRRMILAAPRGREGVKRLEALGVRAVVKRGRVVREGKAEKAREAELAAIEAEYGEAIDEYLLALSQLLPLQRADFAGLFQEMHGHPVTIRTLDPPLHEFLPNAEMLRSALEALNAGKTPRTWATLGPQLEKLMPRGKKFTRVQMVERVLHRVEELHEFNPMLGHRGCRLGITYPEVTAMQARAIFEAAAECIRKGVPVRPHVMIPLVGTVAELEKQKAIVVKAHADVEKELDVKIHAMVGTMIEVPRAALVADEIAREAEFFSFGTNDLTQMTFGYSRDDAGRFILEYLQTGVLPKDPFVSIDASGVGKLMRLAVEAGRSTRPDLEVGICGEHGGDPDSIALCHKLGLEYVSCSPYRVPIARLAAAQAAIVERRQRAAAGEVAPNGHAEGNGRVLARG